MQNVKAEVKGGKLLLEIDLTQDFGVSSSGKSITVARSGFARVDEPDVPAGLGFNLNVWKALPGKAPKS